MKNKRHLVIIYGLPGVGKLSVAKSLAQLTGYILFHNHLSSDLIYSVFPQSSRVAQYLKDHIRLEILEKWAKLSDKSLITTYIYKKDYNENFIYDLAKITRKAKIITFYVHLKCSTSELKKRVASNSRSAYKKINTWNELCLKMKEVNMTENLPVDNNYVIDNTKLSTTAVAIKIQELIS